MQFQGPEQSSLGTKGTTEFSTCMKGEREGRQLGKILPMFFDLDACARIWLLIGDGIFGWGNYINEQSY